MKRLLCLGLCLSMLTAPGFSKEEEKRMELFINGVKATAEPLNELGSTYYPVESVAKALGASMQFNGSEVSLNGQKVPVPPLVVDGQPYLSVEAIASSLGASVEKDPVRGVILLRNAMVNTGPGIAHYTADYRTPDEEERDKRAKAYRDAGLPGMAELDAREAQMQKMMPKTVKALDRSKPPTMSAGPSHPWLSTAPDESSKVPDGAPPEIPQPRYASAGFLTRTGDNGTYRLTLTDLKTAEMLRALNPPALPNPGQKFVVAFVTEENLTKMQLNPVWMGVRDTRGNLYPADQGLSQFSMSSLRARETTNGYVVCQVPVSAQVSSVELICDPPVAVGLSDPRPR